MQHPLKKKPPKRRTRLWLALGVAALALAIAFVCLLPQIMARVPSATETVKVALPMVRTLEIRQAQELDWVEVHSSVGESYTLVCQDDTLYLQEGDALLDLNDAWHDELLQAFTQIVSQETVAQDAAEVEAHLGDMGLAPARASAVIHYRDGQQATLEVGAPVPNTTYAYYRWSGDPGIYMCDVGITDALALTRSHLLPVEQPVVYASLVETLKLTNAYGEARYAFSGSAAGMVEAPIRYPLSGASASELTTALQNLRLGMKECAVTEENRAQLGFDEPLCVIELVQKSGFTSVIASDGTLVNQEIPAQALRFVIGREEDDYFYTCEYEGSAYLVSRFLVQQLVEANPEALITRTPAALESSVLKQLTISAPTGTLEVSAERTESVLPNNQLELDAEGNVVYHTLVSINGREGTQEQLDELCDRLNTLAAEGTVDAAFEPTGDPRWQLRWESADGQTRRLDAYRMDAFSDALCVDGVIRHYVHADALENLISGFLP